jgi:hypothetical protein
MATNMVGPIVLPFSCAGTLIVQVGRPHVGDGSKKDIVR